MQRCVAEDKLDMVSVCMYRPSFMEVYVLQQDGIPSFTKVAFLHSGGRIPPWWRLHSRYGSEGYIPPPLFPVRSAVAGGDPVRVAICTSALTGSRVLVPADAWSGMIVCR